jgi:ATP-dependent DNA helicase RecQ
LLPDEVGVAVRKAAKTRGEKRAGREEVGREATPEEAELEGRLRAWRKAEAAETGKPAFFVFSDAILRALAVAAPRTIPELMTIRGIGPNKADRYGAAICALCREQ